MSATAGPGIRSIDRYYSLFNQFALVILVFIGDKFNTATFFILAVVLIFSDTNYIAIC